MLEIEDEVLGRRGKDAAALSCMMNGRPGGDPSSTTTAWRVSERRTSLPEPVTMMAPVFPDASGRRMIVSRDRGGEAGFTGGDAHPEENAKTRKHARRMPGMRRTAPGLAWSTMRRHHGTGSPTWTAKRVPRMPIEATGVSKRADSGESLPIMPDRYAREPLVMRINSPISPFSGANSKFRTTRRLSGPMERVESSRKTAPRELSVPVERVSPTRSFVPGAAGMVSPPRMTEAVPSMVLTNPAVLSAAAAWPGEWMDAAARTAAMNSAR
jgi:hypothetical protein